MQRLLSSLNPRFPLPILLVQHIAAGFVDGFTSWLASVSPLRVMAAQEGVVPAPGVVYVAPGDRHLCLSRGRLHLDAGEPVSLQRPSGTMLFHSLADSLGPKALGVLLTGMGDDGAHGLKQLRDAGGYTIAEDESTAVVYGMPAAAVRIGAVCESLPLHEVAERLQQFAALGEEARR